jgi:hypothetical protein
MKRIIPWWFWVSAASALMTFAVWFSIPANAEPTDPDVIAYAVKSAPAMCLTLATYPNVAGVLGVLQGIEANGLTPPQAKQALMIGVQRGCPSYLPLVQRYIDTPIPGVEAA